MKQTNKNNTQSKHTADNAGIAFDLQPFIKALEQGEAASQSFVKNIIAIFKQLPSDSINSLTDGVKQYNLEQDSTIEKTGQFNSKIAGTKNTVDEFSNSSMKNLTEALNNQSGNGVNIIFQNMIANLKSLTNLMGNAKTEAGSFWSAMSSQGGSGGGGTDPGSIFTTAFSLVSGLLGLAEGGVVTKPTLAVVGEGQEPEAVMPLSSLNTILASQSLTAFQSQAAPVQNINVNVTGELKGSGMSLRATLQQADREADKR